MFSIQKILFPLWDSKSVLLLESLVESSSFDPDILVYPETSIVNDDEEKIEFQYFGTRLSELYDELRNPRPRGRLATWLERRSGARYVMLATVIGVAFAVVLGFGSLILSAYQARVAYEAWQHPVVAGS